jgi:exosome complex RNA-binding protein Rrp42 (RNase PH superfamily)
METKGQKIVLGVGVWLVVKSLINLVLGFGFGNILSLIIAAVLTAVMIAGVPYTNYVTAVIVAIVVIKNLPYNISNAQIFYLIEAVIDVVAVVLLCASRDVKEHCERK